jgi:arabinose-5-phosphate isomerase
VEACRLILACKGRVVVTGMGKSGHVARKIAATLASTGTPAFFVHPGEASHGDLGMILPQDVVLALSYSGETDELLFILPVIKRQGIPLIAITGNPDSSLADPGRCAPGRQHSAEACPLGLAPTASTTAALVMGDALAIALLEARGFTSDDFARSHPAGSLGRRLLLHISDVMHTGDDVPRSRPMPASPKPCGNDPQAPGHDRRGRRRPASAWRVHRRRSCAVRWTTTASICAAPRWPI